MIRILGKADVAALLGIGECIEVVEQAFVQHATGRLAAPPGVLGTHLPGGGFHVKSAVMGQDPMYYAAKINANFPENPARRGLPAIQGMIALFDAVSGRPLALMDSIEITTQRTAAATAVAARHLARTNAESVAIIGCGNQGRANLRALVRVRPISRAFALDRDQDRCRAFAGEMARELGVTVTPSDDVIVALQASDIAVTCTPSRQPIVSPASVRPGHFIAAVGADHPEKQELDPAILPRVFVVVDILAQAATIGDLHHAIAAGLMSAEGAYAELGEICAGLKAGRTGEDQVYVFDSTGTALQDVAAAALVYERAEREGRGLEFSLDG